MAALSWAAAAHELAMLASVDGGAWGGAGAGAPSRVGIIAPDLRGHGHTSHTHPSAENNLAIDTLAADLEGVLLAILRGRGGAENSSGASGADGDAKAAWQLVLVGHSLGGAVATHLCTRLLERAEPGWAGDDSTRVCLQVGQAQRKKNLAIFDVARQPISGCGTGAVRLRGRYCPRLAGPSRATPSGDARAAISEPQPCRSLGSPQRRPAEAGICQNIHASAPCRIAGGGRRGRQLGRSCRLHPRGGVEVAN